MNPDRFGDDGIEWDESLTRLDGDLLQSWKWGAFKQAHGWVPERIRVSGPAGDAMAQLLFRHRGPYSIGYLPRGPINASGHDVAARLLDEIDRVCGQHRAIVLVVEPAEPLPASWIAPAGPFVRGPVTFQTSRTVQVELSDDQTLLAQMRKDTRANIAHAQRRGVLIESAPASKANLDLFYRLLQESSAWNDFGIHVRTYYADFLCTFGSNAVLLFARSGDTVTAALIAARVGPRARSMYAGSHPSRRGRGDAALLRFAAMQWARDQGCVSYDLGGIAPATKPAAREGTGLKGVDTFKTGFGGDIVTYPETVERRYRPVVAWMVRRVNARFAPGPDDDSGA